jgi:lipopolysaccharide transport system permease protein
MIANLRALAGYRELLFNFAKKELKVKYKNSVLGFFWSLLNPVLMMIVFTFVFAILMRFPAEIIDYYPIFFLAGLLPWNFFNTSVMSSTASIVGNGALIKKVYFPRELLPLSILLANLVNFALELGVLVVFMLFTGFTIPRFFDFYQFLPWLLVLVPILFLFTFGISLLVAAVNVYFRDIQHLIGIFLMVLFYATPIIYPLAVVPAKYLRLYSLNPMTTIIMSFKNALFFLVNPSLKFVLYSGSAALAVFLVGYYVFLKLEPGFAEEI